ncbi:MAG: hypothetical protein IPG71_13765 [bacterium]|nr:hypothetical protein [bacterium]
MQKRQFYRIIAVSMLTAFVLTATVPYFCSTGWCCGQHKSQALTTPVMFGPDEAAPESDCCGGGGPQAPATDETDCCGGGISMKANAPETDCCGGGPQPLRETADNSCGGSCATGCCKIAAASYVRAADCDGVILDHLATIDPADALNTGIELTDYVPQPPSLFCA